MYCNADSIDRRPLIDLRFHSTLHTYVRTHATSSGNVLLLVGNRSAGTINRTTKSIIHVSEIYDFLAVENVTMYPKRI